MPIKKKLSIILAVIILAAPIIIAGTLASEDPLKLPTDPVRIEVFDGAQAYFDTKLSDVPSGYTVSNGTYLGWCIDQSAEMARSPAQHTVQLYSSLSPPGELAHENWTMVNYILNHKQGDMMDIQGAIWYFINMVGNCSPPSSISQAIVNDALANGTGFVPSENQLVAVICYSLALFPTDKNVQMSIIEVTMPKSSTPLPTPAPSTSPQPTSQPQTTPTPQQTQQPSPTATPTTIPQNTQPSPTPGNDNQPAISGIIGAGLAGIAAIAIIALLLLVLKRRKK